MICGCVDVWMCGGDCKHCWHGLYGVCAVNREYFIVKIFSDSLDIYIYIYIYIYMYIYMQKLNALIHTCNMCTINGNMLYRVICPKII